MPALSPIARQFLRYAIHKESAQAVAEAAKAAAALVSGANQRRLQITARRQAACATTFRCRMVTPSGEPTTLQLSNKRACKCPACFLCARMKAAKMRTKFIELVHIAQELHPRSPFLFLNLTLRNRPWADLTAMLNDLAAAEHRLFKMAPLKKAFLGRITAFEIACRGTKENPEAGAHIHILLQAHEDYFSREHDFYLSQARLTHLFQQAARTTYPPIIHISRVRAADGSTDGVSLDHAIRELIKYCLKPADLFERADDGQPVNALTADPAVVAVLVKALHRRRMVRTVGSFSEASRIRTKQQKEDPTT